MSPLPPLPVVRDAILCPGFLSSVTARTLATSASSLGVVAFKPVQPMPGRIGNACVRAKTRVSGSISFSTRRKTCIFVQRAPLAPTRRRFILFFKDTYARLENKFLPDIKSRRHSTLP